MANLIDILEKNRQNAGLEQPAAAAKSSEPAPRSPVKGGLKTQSSSNSSGSLLDILERNREKNLTYKRAGGLSLMDVLERNRAAEQQAQPVQQPVIGKPDRQSFLASTPYAGYLNMDDYDQLSKVGGSKLRLLGGDQRYDYINNINNFQTMQDAQMRSGNYSRYKYLTDDERGVYNYLYAKEGKKAANRFLDALEASLDEEEYNQVYAPAAQQLSEFNRVVNPETGEYEDTGELLRLFQPM